MSCATASRTAPAGRLWRTRSFALANLGSLFYGAALFPWLLVGVLVLTQVWGYSPLQAGLAMTPGAIVASAVALRAGPLVARHGPRPVVVGGALVLVGVALWIGLALGDHPRFLAFWLPGGVLIGIGTGAITTGLSAAAALSVAPPRFAAATGLNQTARQVGGALGVAALATMLRHADGTSVAPYAHVYFFCAAASGAAALAGLRLVLRSDGAA
jgi:MFS family permease